MLKTLLFALEIKFVLKIESNAYGIKRILYYNTNVSCFSLHFFRALAAFCVLYNRTEHSQSFSVC